MKRLFRQQLPHACEQPSARFLATALSLAFLLLSPGCSKESVQGFADKVKDQGESLVNEGKKAADSLVETAKEQLPETGEITLQLSEPLKLDAAIIRLYDVGDGRQRSLQITSYEPGTETVKAPSFFLQCSTDIETVALAAGKTLSCTAFFDPGSNAPLARTPLSQPVELTLGSMNMQEKTIEGSLKSFTLLGTDGKPVEVSGGKILALVQD